MGKNLPAGYGGGATLIALLLVWAVPALNAQVLQTVKVGTAGTLSDGALYIAQEKGYFKELGINMELTTFASAAQAMAPLSTNEIQVAGGGISIGLFNGFARGLPIRVVASRSYLVHNNDGNIFMIRTDLKDAIKRPADLKGRKFAINATGSPLVYMLGKAMESDGMSLKDVEVVTIPFPAMPTAFKNKAIDAGIEVEPFVAVAAEQGLATRWKEAAEYAPFMQVAVLFYNDDWAKKNPETAREFMVGYLKGAREFYDALEGGKNRGEVIDIMAKHTRIKDKALYDKMYWNFMDPNGQVIKDSLEDQQEWYFKNGLMPQKVPVEKLVDESYLKYALEKLGTHPCARCYKRKG